MNSIELFEKASIYVENQSGFTLEDTIKVQKQFEIERAQNPTLDATIAANLTAAMNENPKELLFISNNRVLYNFFAKTSHSRNRFLSEAKIEVSSDAIKQFIEKYLGKDLEIYFEEKINQNRFEELDDFLAVKEYLPQSSLNSLNTKIAEKLDMVLDKLEKTPNYVDALTFNYIKHRSFYDLLSQFRSVDNDRRIRELLAVMYSDKISFDIKTEFLNPMLLSMANYKAVDNDLLNLLKSNKEETLVRTQKVSSSSSSALSTGGIIVVVILVIRLFLLMVRCNRM